MKSKARFYHAGCPVCISAQEGLLFSLDPTRYEIEVIDLGKEKDRIAEAKELGITSVPAIVLGNNVYHINFGAALSDLEKGATGLKEELVGRHTEECRAKERDRYTLGA